jgi:PEGA domain
MQRFLPPYTDPGLPINTAILARVAIGFYSRAKFWEDSISTVAGQSASFLGAKARSMFVNEHENDFRTSDSGFIASGSPLKKKADLVACLPLCTNCATNLSHFDKADCMLPALARSRLAVSVISAVCFLLCSGCASHSNNSLPRQSVQIVSQPPGARIEINGRYAGDAPTTVEIESSPHGRFWKDTIIKAYPKTGYIQIKAFNGESRWSISDPIPGRISFDTRIDPTAGLNETQGR